MRLPPFTVTPPAIDQIEAVGGCVRVDLEPGGCSGRAYAWSMPTPAPATRSTAATARGGGERGRRPGARRVVVDYGAALRPPRFRVIRNPNTAERCACNRSFGRPWPGRGHPDCRARDPMPWADG